MKKLITIFMSLIMIVSVVTSTTAFATDNTSNDSDEMCKIYFSSILRDYGLEHDFLTNPQREVAKGQSYTTNIKFDIGKKPYGVEGYFDVTAIMADGTIITPTLISENIISIVVPEVRDDIYIYVECYCYDEDEMLVGGDNTGIFVWNLNNVVCDTDSLIKGTSKGCRTIYIFGAGTYKPKDGYKITSVKLIKITPKYYLSTNEISYKVEDISESNTVIDKGDGTYYIGNWTPGNYYLEINAEPMEKPTEPTKPVVKNTTVKLEKAKANLYVKGTTNIKATVKNGKGKTTYKSSNPKVAKVNSNGKVTAVKKGTAKITITNNKVSKVFTVTVKNPKLNKTSLALKKNKSYTLKVTGKVGKATFSTSNKKVATVNQKGKVVAKKKGKATITVKTNGMKLKCKVTVK